MTSERKLPKRRQHEEKDKRPSGPVNVQKAKYDQAGPKPHKTRSQDTSTKKSDQQQRKTTA